MEKEQLEKLLADLVQVVDILYLNLNNLVGDLANLKHKIWETIYENGEKK